MELRYVTQAFRDVADQDYAAARAMYRLSLDLQFLWFAEQAVEKYLKAILLYNGQDSRVGHRITKAFERLREIDDIAFDFPAETREFLELLQKCGPDRYLSKPWFAFGNELELLDQTVWHARRYCQYFRGDPDRFPVAVSVVTAPAFKNKPWTFRILDGELERILDNSDWPLGDDVRWRNTFFAEGAAAPPQRMKSINPVTVFAPGLFQALRERIHFPSDAVEAFSAELDTDHPWRLEFQGLRQGDG